MKKYIIWIVACILAFLGCALAGVQWVEKSWLPDKMANLSIMGQPASFSSQPVLSLFPPTLKLGKLAWHGKFAGFNLEFSVQSAQIAPDLFSFLGNQPELREIVVEKPVIYLQKIESGAEAAKPQLPAMQFGTESGLGIGRFVAQNGELIYKNDKLNISLDNLRLTGENLRPRQESTVQCDFGVALGNSFGKILSGNCALKTDLRYYAPNLTFRNGSITFTALEPPFAQAFFAPCRAQFEGALNMRTLEQRLARCAIDLPLGRLEIEGETEKNGFSGKLRAEIEVSRFARLQNNLVVESPFVVAADKMELVGGDISSGDFQAAIDASMFFVNKGTRAVVNGQWAQGQFAIKLADNGQGSELSLSASQISLGEILRQAGVNGFAGGPTKFTGKLAFPNGDAQAILKQAKGSGVLDCGRLELEPFGEISMLLPLLGHSGALIPKVMESLDIDFKVDKGQLILKPILGKGPEFDLRGSANLDMLQDVISGDVIIRALGLELPLSFAGALSRPNIRIDPELLKR